MAREQDATPGGNRAGFTLWLVAVQPHLQRLARSLTDSPSEAADLVQATNLRAWERRSLFVRGAAEDLRRWLFRIMVNLRRDLWRKEAHELPSGWLDKVAKPEEPPPPRWAALDDDEVAVAVDGLHPRLREAYRMFAVERASYATISARLRVPRATVATRIFRARLRLREKLAQGERVAA